MTKPSRLRLIKAIHRKHLRSQGLKVNLTKAEALEVNERVSAGETPEEIAPDYGVTPRRIRRITVNRLFYSGMTTGEEGLTMIQRKAVMGLGD